MGGFWMITQNLAMGGGPPEISGPLVGFTMKPNRPEFTMPANRPEYTMDDNRPEFTMRRTT